MVTITFKGMDLLKDRNTVKIIGDCFGSLVVIEISILQLAKVFGTDRNIGQEIGSNFGSKEYEDKCEETREYIKKYPNVEVWDKEIEFKDVSVDIENATRKSMYPETVGIYAEDIVGWDNEAVRIYFPEKVYNQTLKDKKFKVFVSPFFVEFKLNKD